MENSEKIFTIALSLAKILRQKSNKNIICLKKAFRSK